MNIENLIARSIESNATISHHYGADRDAYAAAKEALLGRPECDDSNETHDESDGNRLEAWGTDDGIGDWRVVIECD